MPSLPHNHSWSWARHCAPSPYSQGMFSIELGAFLPLCGVPDSMLENTYM